MSPNNLFEESPLFSPVCLASCHTAARASHSLTHSCRLKSFYLSLSHIFILPVASLSLSSFSIQSSLSPSPPFLSLQLLRRLTPFTHLITAIHRSSHSLSPIPPSLPSWPPFYLPSLSLHSAIVLLNPLCNLKFSYTSPSNFLSLVSLSSQLLCHGFVFLSSSAFVPLRQKNFHWICPLIQESYIFSLFFLLYFSRFPKVGRIFSFVLITSRRPLPILPHPVVQKSSLLPLPFFSSLSPLPSVLKIRRCASWPSVTFSLISSAWFSLFHCIYTLFFYPCCMVRRRDQTQIYMNSKLTLSVLLWCN